MYPYRSLQENLAAFCAGLRENHGFRIGPRELQDAARALGVTRLGEERAVRDALRPVLCSRVEHVAAFDDAFDAFFHPTAAAARPAMAARAIPSPERDSAVDEQPTGRAGPRPGEPVDEASSVPGDGDVVVPFDVRGEDEGALSTGVVRSSYSPLHGEGAAPNLEPVDAFWRAGAAALVHALSGGRSRRWRPARRGERFDLRRTLRHSLHTGGEAVIPRWQNRPRRRVRLVLFVDGSRSMGAHARIALDIAVAIATVTPHLEAFAFSTTVQRLTRDVRRAAAGERRRLDYLHRAWGGGTSIGACLQTFVRACGDRLLGRDAVILIVSDGLDVGAPDVLREAMARLHRECRAVIWLNPLLHTPGYEPTASGMSAARPFVSTFSCVANPAELQQLACRVRVRR